MTTTLEISFSAAPTRCGRCCARRRLAAALAAALLGVLAYAAAARAGTYTIGDCAMAFNQTAAAGPWTFVGGNEGPANVSVKPSCAGGVGDWIGFSIDRLPGFTGFRATTVGTNLTIAGARVWWRAFGSYESANPGNFPRSYGEIVDGQGHGTSLFNTGTVWDTTNSPVSVTFPAADAATTAMIGEDCDPYNNLLFCPMPSSNPQYDALPLGVQIYGVELTLQDNVAPSAEVVGGSLDGPGPVTGPAQLAFVASDQDAGIRGAQLLVDGEPVATRSYASSCGYTQLQACPGSVSDQFTWNSGSVSPGQHQIALEVTDAAGNTTLSSPHDVDVLAPIGPNGTPCAGSAITVRLGGSASPRPIRYGQHPTVEGLLHCAATPIAGAIVDVGAATIAAGTAGARPIATVRTRADGSFSYRLGAGASRTLSFSYTAYSDDPTPASASAITIRVIPTISLKITPRRTHNRGTIEWTGKVAGGPYPAGGVSLQAQVREDGRWVTFDDILARRGRFEYAYTFLRTTEPTSYLFRVALPHGGAVGYPYQWAASRGINVRVR